VEVKGERCLGAIAKDPEEGGGRSRGRLRHDQGFRKQKYAKQFIVGLGYGLCCISTIVARRQ
jgi:hypothetical protein